MGKKKRGHPNVEDLLNRPWCYYCERDFEDLKLLISHQKAKHFKCDRCGRRLNTAGGLSVHLNQVHKETLDHVENALPNRQGLEVEIFGMEGMPQESLDQHRNCIIQNFYQEQEDRRIATGNPLPGQGGPARKKVKMETQDDLLKRFAEFREKKKAAAAAGVPVDADGLPIANGNGAGAGQNGDQQQHQQQPPQAYGQPPYGYSADGLPARPSNNIPDPSGLPQRPGYGGAAPPPGQGDDIDQMIRMAEAGIRPAGDVPPPPVAAAAGGDAAGGDKKAGKKDKEKKGKMIYDDAEVSPEERIAALPRYVFRPEVAA